MHDDDYQVHAESQDAHLVEIEREIAGDLRAGVYDFEWLNGDLPSYEEENKRSVDCAAFSFYFNHV